MKEFFLSKRFFVGITLFLLGMAALGTINTIFHYTNEMSFCTACHSMKVNLEEYKNTIHFNNRTGVQATCADCHVPKEFLPKLGAKIMAAKDVYHWLLGTIEPDTTQMIKGDEGQCADYFMPLKEGSDYCVPNYGEAYSEDMSDEASERRQAALSKYNAYRWKMASSVWAKMEANDSRECRSCHNFNNMALESQGRSARNKHARATGKGQTCIECHKGIAHIEPDEPEVAEQ